MLTFSYPTSKVALTAVTAYEQSIRDLLVEFCIRKHQTFGHFAGKYFETINARIRVKDLKKDYLSMFGPKYLKRFDAYLKTVEDWVLRHDGASVRSSYGNLITWRHQFAHEGEIVQNPTCQEVIRSYHYGKNVIVGLGQILWR